MKLTRDALQSWWYDIGNSLWFVPALFVANAFALALVTVRIDQQVQFERNLLSAWVFGGGSEGARGVLSAIAGTMMTVTALVFSITIVALQLAASQLTPRVLRSVMADRGNQAVLGVFVGTFTYALIVLRSVRSPLEDEGGFVPALSVTVAIGLTLLSIAMLIFFMHHSANSLRASVVIARIADATRGLIEHLYPADIGRPAPGPATIPGVAGIVRAESSGYLRAIDADALFDLAEDHELIIRLDPFIGEFILPGAKLASVWGAGADDDEVAHAIRDALDLGAERTMQSDVGFGMQQLSDIALRALSPGINDPTTAMVVVNQLAALIVLIANRGEPEQTRDGDDGSVRLILPAPTFREFVQIAFEQIRHFGGDNPTFARHVATTLERAADLVPPEKRWPLLRFTTDASEPAAAAERRDAGFPAAGRS